MGDTSIEWTRNSDGSKGKSWNPIAAYFNGKRGWMCSKPSTGCKHCYSERLNQRLGNGLLYTAENAAKIEWRLVNLDEPGKWRKPQKCFVESMGDLFHEALPDELIGRVWSKMLEFPQHTFQVLTKRPERMRGLVTRLTEEAERKGLRSADHIWLGTSVENQEQADKRIPELLKVPAAVRFLSCEPLLGDVSFQRQIRGTEWNLLTGEQREGGFRSRPGHGIDWVIVGGESGPGARPMHPDWVRSLLGQCQAAGVPFFFKQYGEFSAPDDLNTGLLDSYGKVRGMEYVNLDGTHGGISLEADGYGYPSPENKKWYWDCDAGERSDVKQGAVFVQRIGKKAAGRILDGRTWDEFPEA